MSIMTKNGIPVINRWDGVPTVVCTTPIIDDDGHEVGYCGHVIALTEPYVVSLEMTCELSHRAEERPSS
jgi:hypothetical protein